MMRSALISLSKATWAQRMITRWGFARRAARRFVAGETSDDAISAVRGLNARGILATLDHLGENTASQADAHLATGEICRLLEKIHHAGIRANVSIKLSQLGLAINVELCRENLVRILEVARRTGNFVRVDMEGSATTSQTLEMVRWVKTEVYSRVGVVIQAYLRRSEGDISGLIEDQVAVRLCKGAYQEPDSVAFPRKKDVDASYDHLAELLLSASQTAGMAQPNLDGRAPPLAAIATHDERRIEHALNFIDKINLPHECVEFQMLYGIRRDLQETLVARGYPVRVYVPYGSHWYPYLMRRMAERPANLWFFAINFFRK